MRQAACQCYRELAEGTRKQSGIQMNWQVVQETAAVPCSGELSGRLKQAARRHLDEIEELPSGAGHDAAVMAAICPVAMLFVRCRDGLSHHPAESAAEDDVRVALAVMNDFLKLLSQTT